MKKTFTLMLMCLLAIAAQAKITIYVQCETAPFLWTWEPKGGTFDNVGDWPGALQFTEKYTHPDTGETFWMYAFPDEITQISFLFNNGETPTKQTTDLSGVTSDRYFILAWDDGEGNVSLKDITEDYIEVPDAEITSCGISGSHNGWALPEGSDLTVVEAGKVYSFTATAEGLGTSEWEFKFRPNGLWLGYSDFSYDGGAAPEWLADNNGNFFINFTESNIKSVTFTLTWGGGKDASKNWTLKAEATFNEGEAPDATITSCGISGNHNGWALPEGSDLTVVEAGKVYSFAAKASDLGIAEWEFKFRPNELWLGYSEVTFDPAAPEWLTDNNGNFFINFTESNIEAVIFTLTWGGGKSATKNWTLKAEATTAANIAIAKSENLANMVIYNLQGQRIQAGFRGIAVKNGRKMIMK
jgi:hypothetical protein